jgi:ribosomal protein S27AE
MTEAAGRLGINDGDYEFLICPNCGKKFGELLVIEGRVVYKKDPCPRCGRTVFITKDLTPRDGGRRMPGTKGARP